MIIIFRKWIVKIDFINLIKSCHPVIRINNQIYLTAYFDNENSVNRYYDLANYLASK